MFRPAPGQRSLVSAARGAAAPELRRSTSLPGITAPLKRLGGSSSPSSLGASAGAGVASLVGAGLGQRAAEGHDVSENATGIVPNSVLGLFRRWALAFCTVTFDLELGPSMEYVYPMCEFTAQECANICFSAFPDSNTFGVGETVYTFRFRYSGDPSSSCTFYHGCVFFRQRRDPLLKRGYFQKSLVLITPHSYVGLFTRIMSQLGGAYFDTGKTILETACHMIASWPHPEAGATLQLPFLGTAYCVRLPYADQPQLLETCSFTDGQLRLDRDILASISLDGLIGSFLGIMECLWLCWELLLLGEPLIVVGRTPKHCSDGIFALLGLIHPIPYCGDFRPYFTIHDSDSSSYIHAKHIPSNVILGVTSPFICKAVQHWPHILTLPPSNGLGRASMFDSPMPTSSNRGGFDLLRNNRSHATHGLKSRRKGIIAVDHVLAQTAIETFSSGAVPSYMVNNIVRHHFIELTEKFLSPLNRYFSTLMPSIRDISSALHPPKLKPFRQDDFLASLAEHGPQLPINTVFGHQSELTRLYQQFLTCGNFATWLHQRSTHAMVELLRRQRHMLCTANMDQWAADGGRSQAELELVRDRLHSEIRSMLHHTRASDRSGRDAKGTAGLPEMQRRDRQGAGELSMLQAQLDIVHRRLQQH